MKPVRLPAAAVIALPRWSIVALCLLYILPGLIGRDPWKGNDAAGFGIMWTMAHGNINDILWPHIVGLPMPEDGPLAYWLGAICIKIFGGILGDPMAARIATGLAFMLGVFSVWYSTYLLGRRNEAQPLKLAFGGQPEPKDFGRTLADGALLIYLGCLGLLLPSHTTSVGPLLIALVALTLYFSVRFFDHPLKRTACTLGFVLGLLVLTRGWVIPSAILLCLVTLSIYRQQKKLILNLLGLSLPIAALITACWLFILHINHPFDSSPLPAWMEWNYRQINLPSLSSTGYFFRYGIWFTWPAWPFAAWAIYAWRKQEHALHIALPVSFLFCFSLLALITNVREEANLLPLLPALSILAAFGLPTMKRSAINAVDWFAVMIMTGTAGLAWFGWASTQLHWPSNTSKKILSWAPGFQATFELFSFIIALIVTIIWFRVVYWRISRQPSVLWRAVVLSSGGVILFWFLLMSLWLPLINHRVSYSLVATDMAASIASTPYRCIDSQIGASQRASFAYFGKVHFAGFTEQNCDLLLLQGNRRSPTKLRTPADQDFPGVWQLIWEGQRAADKDEFFSLYRKK